MLRLRPAPSHCWSSWLLAARGPGRRRRRPPQAWPQLLGQHRDHGSGAAVLGRPAPLLELAHDHDRLPFESDRATCLAWSRHTITVKNEASCSRLPETATRNVARAIPPAVCRSSGSSVRLPAKLTLASVMALPSWDCLAGRAALPLEPGDGGRRGMPQDRQGQATEPTKSARLDQAPAIGRLGCRVGWSTCLRLGVGHASTVRPDPSILGVVGDRGSHHEDCSQSVPGSAADRPQPPCSKASRSCV
jgi:hypothetical protein